MDLYTALFLLADGLTNGAVYALVGVSLVLIYSTTRVVNIAQGEYVTFGALSLASFIEGAIAPVAWVVALGGAACLALADYLKMAKETTESRLVKVAIGGEQALDKPRQELVRQMKERGLEAVGAESEALFQEVIDHYADVRIESNYPQDAAELARGELHVLRDLGIGRKAPDIDGKDIRGKAMRLADYRGKVVVLDFGSHRSCGVCRQMYPYLRAMVEKYREQPFALLGVSVEDDVKELVSLADRGENTWPIWWDGENLQGPLAAEWVIRAMPTFYVLDPKGVIRNKGFLQPADLEATVDMLLKEMNLPRP